MQYVLFEVLLLKVTWRRAASGVIQCLGPPPLNQLSIEAPAILEFLGHLHQTMFSLPVLVLAARIST